MKHMVFLACIALATAGCSSGGGSSDGGTTTPTNSAPLVSAGADQNVTEGASVTLTATATDANNDTLTYVWTKVSGADVTLSSTNAASTSFTAPEVTAEQNFEFQISVSDGTVSVTDNIIVTVFDTATPLPTNETEWIVSSGEVSTVFTDNGSFIDVDVLSVTTGTDTVSVTTNSVPSYKITVTEAILDWYAGYAAGASADEGLSLGQVINFGEDIGLSQSACTTGGNGWWPSGGGSCLSSLGEASITFTTSPAATTTSCETGLGAVGLWVNGVYMYNWSDGQSYNNAGVWNKFAIPFRSKGMDLCLGHGGGRSTIYHHHNYNECLRQELNDEGTGHSPVYGYAGDGYAVHGPYQDVNALATSCWVVRDYSASSATGCGTDGARTCGYSDYTNPGASPDVTYTGTSVGPTTSELVGIDYDNVAAEAGFYKEDYIFDTSCQAQGAQYLDEHNGHSHDALGYHYHTSVDSDMFPTFPLSPGVEYYGEATQSFSCSGGGVAP